MGILNCHMGIADNVTLLTNPMFYYIYRKICLLNGCYCFSAVVKIIFRIWSL